MILPILLTLTAIDGDTIRAGNERLRLLGIDAPELHGCRKGRVCVPGDGRQSKAALARLLTGRIRIDRVSRDRYGRSLVHVYADGRNVACVMVREGQAAYIAKWDNGGRLARECR